MTLILSLYLASGIVVDELKSVKFMFDELRHRKGHSYTSDEEAEHFGRFAEELGTPAKAISGDDISDLFDETKPAILQGLVDEINSKQSRWTASVKQGRFEGLTIRDAKRLCGTFIDRSGSLAQKDYLGDDLQTLPDSFDARVGFNECKDIIGHVRDQSDCGSCWALAVTEAFNYRVCMESKGQKKALMSAGDMLACCNGAHDCPHWPGKEGNKFITMASPF
ncbi:hypothetical protein FOL47_006777 [Perkinsus chesapeaki]|uniref:Peptidase C1A papain C-terminal domain-containing protein n=1 Tax=Perkinsus chesapeaki TaxID=330153 RepID=A0A7J6LQF8_PERCH|nr:hypothetical protein FOL47_006777 [Perkinsus chesapeaki]